MVSRTVRALALWSSFVVFSSAVPAVDSGGGLAGRSASSYGETNLLAQASTTPHGRCIDPPLRPELGAEFREPDKQSRLVGVLWLEEISESTCVAQKGGEWKLAPVNPRLSLYDVGSIIRSQLSLPGGSNFALRLAHDPPSFPAFTRNLKLSKDVTSLFHTLVYETMQPTPHKARSEDGVEGVEWQHWRPKTKTAVFTDIYQVKAKRIGASSEEAHADCQREGQTESIYIAQMWVYGKEKLGFMTPPCPNTWPKRNPDGSTPDGTGTI